MPFKPSAKGAHACATIFFLHKLKLRLPLIEGMALNLIDGGDYLDVMHEI